MKILNIVAFSLYGDRAIYNFGALENAVAVTHLYPGWTAYFFCGTSVSDDLVRELENLKAIVVKVDGPEGYSSSSWRFHAALIPGAKRVIFRDCDSRISPREVAAVKDWDRSGKPFHIMRDHPNHLWPIQAGMFGVKPELAPDFCLELQRAVIGNYYGGDQDFLADIVWAKHRRECFRHDDFAFKTWNVSRFPTDRNSYEFVGEVFSESGTVEQGPRRQIESFEKSLLIRLATNFRFLSHSLRRKLRKGLSSQ